MKKLKQHRTLVKAGVLAAVCGGIFAYGWQPVDTIRQPASIRARTTRELHERKVAAIERMNTGDHAGARIEFQRMIDRPSNALDSIDGRRMMAMSMRQVGEIAAAEVFLAEALDALNAAAVDAETDASMRSTIMMDQADLAAFSARDREKAIRLYDTVLAARVRSRDYSTAARNAAILSAEIERYEEAAQRIDDFLAVPEAKRIPTDELVPLLCSQASWFASAGNIEEAARRYRAVWDTHQEPPSAYAALAGARVAAWCPPQTDCNTKMDLARGVLNMVDRLRSPDGVARQSSSDRDVLNSAEQQVAISILNAAGCADAGMIEDANRRLRRP